MEQESKSETTEEVKVELSSALSWWESLSVHKRQDFRWKFGNPLDGYMSQEKLVNLFKSEVETSANTDNGWISIEDRLPNTGEYILTYSEKNGIQFQYFSMMYADAELPEWKENTSITHWQKLPQPPNKIAPKESNKLSRKIPDSDIKYFKKRESK